MRLRILPFLMLPLLGIGQTNSKVEKPIGELLSNEISPNEIKRNASFNLDEIKVRWKKAALENCTGVPCIVAPSFTCGTSTVSDLDGNSYNTVLIGTQCWTKQNLKVTQYNDGTPIPLDASGGSSGNGVGQTWSSRIEGAYTIYGNEPSTGPNATNYGFLYNWYAAKGISAPISTSHKNLCPVGWHVATDGDLTTLIKFIDPAVNDNTVGVQSATAGGKMKSTSTLWSPATPPSPGTDNYGFAFLPGGLREGTSPFSTGSFGYQINQGFVWSSTESVGIDQAWYRFLSSSDATVWRHNDLAIKKSFGLSVRCLKD